MFKLLAASLLALLIPVFWAVGAKAQSATQDHSRYWSESADTSAMSPRQRQTYQIRHDILRKADAMKNIYRMMRSSSSYLETAKGLIDAAEVVRNQSNLTNDYLSLETYLNQVSIFHAALVELHRI